MNIKKEENLNIDLIPPFWFSFPKMGLPIRIPDKPNIFLIPMKTPLSLEIQKHFEENDIWSIDRAAIEAAKLIGEQRKYTMIRSYEVTPYVDLISKSDCALFDVTHIHLPINDNNPEEALDHFIQEINEIPSPGYTYAILISCHNGFNRTGYLISGFFMKTMNLSSRAATFLFAKKRHPGIFSQDIINNLNKISPNSQLSTKAQMPKYIRPFMEEVADDHFEENLGITIDSTPNFVFNGGYLVKDTAKISELSNFLKSVICADGKFSRRPNTEYIPSQFFFNQDRINKLQRDNKSVNDIRITFSPHGSQVFFIIDKTQNDVFYISYEYNQFYFFRAIIASSVPRPILCTAIYTTKDNDPILFITDVLVYGEMLLEKIFIDDRLKCIWYYILPYIKVLPPFQLEDSTDDRNDFHLIKLAFRPVAYLRSAQNVIYNFSYTSNTFDGIPCNGINIFDRHYMVGASLFVPLAPSLTLFFVLNTPDKAILYARSDYNTKIPVLTFRVNLRAASLNRRIVNMRFIFQNQMVSLVPDSICKNKLIDMVSYSKEMICYMSDKSNFRHIWFPRELLHTLKCFINLKKKKMKS